MWYGTDAILLFFAIVFFINCIQEHKEKLSQSIKSYYENNPEITIKLSNNQKNKIKICKENEIKDKTKIKLSHSQFKRKVQNIEAKEIFDSARDVPNINQSNIRRAIRDNGTAGGYHWKYVD